MVGEIKIEIKTGNFVFEGTLCKGTYYKKRAF